MKKIACIILIVALLIPFANIASASSIQPYSSELFSSTGVLISPKSNGTIVISTSTTATTVIDKLGFTSLTVQAYIDDSWQSVYRVSNKFSYDASIHGYSLTYNSVEGRKYRAVVKFSATDGSTTDTRTRTSGSVTSK